MGESASPRGRLIAICGIDGSGKTTQEQLLVDGLGQLVEVVQTCQPTP